MMPKLYETIEAAIAKGVPPQYIADGLIKAGWPEGLVNEAIEAWLSAHGRLQQKTGFKQWLAKYKRRALPATSLMVFVGVFSSSILLLKPWPTKIMVDSAFGYLPAPGPLEPYTHTPRLILITSVLTLFIFVLGAIFGVVRDYLNLRLGFWLNRGIKEESFRHILHMPLYHQERLAKGDYIYRQNVLTNSLSDLVLDTTSSIIQSVIMVVAILLIMLSFNVQLTIISVVLVPFLFVLIRLFGPRLGKIARALTKVNSDTSSTTTQAVDNAETVQAFTLEEKEINKADKLWRDNYLLSKMGLLWSHMFRSTNSLLIILGTSAVMYFGGTAALQGKMTLGQLLIFMTYMGYLLGPIESIAAEIANRNQKLVDVSRVYEVLTDHEGVEDLRQDRHLPPIRGRLEFQSVSYAYSDRLVLDNINLTVEAGQKVGIIGPSGGGKSTLLKLIPLFIEPTSGRVLIDTYDVQTVSLKELRQHIAWISQNPQLFNGTIAENLMDGDVNRQVSQAEIEKAAAAANVNEFAERFPQGLNSIVGENGNSLSGGQKQRVAIARGLLKKASIVCMDEPTAALDSKSERYIRDSIEQLIHGKTVLMVTHRKALLSLMDTVYVMEGGVLKNVRHYGGLDAYLKKIKDIEGEAVIEGDQVALTPEQLEALRLQQSRLQQLEYQNARLSEELGSSEQRRRQAEDDTGTIYISH